MKEENKKFDEAEVQPKLPEFTITKKATKKEEEKGEDNLDAEIDPDLDDIDLKTKAPSTWTEKENKKEGN